MNTGMKQCLINFLLIKGSGERIGTNLIAILNNSDEIIEVVNSAIKRLNNPKSLELDDIFTFDRVKPISEFLKLLLSREYFETYYYDYENSLRELLIRRLKNSTDSNDKKYTQKRLQSVSDVEHQEYLQRHCCLKYFHYLIKDILRFKQFFEVMQRITGFNVNYENNFNSINFETISEEERTCLSQLFSFLHNISIPESVISYGKVDNNQLSLINANELKLTNDGVASISGRKIPFESICSEFCSNQVVRIHRFKVKNICDFLNISLYMLMSQNVIINKCHNCGKYFFVKSKSTEKYCSNIYRNGKTCSELSYEIKVSKDEIAKLCRNASKKSAVYKHRYCNNMPKATVLHEKFLKAIKKQKQLCENGEISLKEFDEWIDNNNWWNKKK